MLSSLKKIIALLNAYNMNLKGFVSRKKIMTNIKNFQLKFLLLVLLELVLKIDNN